MTDIVDDQIDSIGRGFLGLTIACARCHDHKFDPISTADYYGLAGIFFSSRILSDPAYLSQTPSRLKVALALRPGRGEPAADWPASRSGRTGFRRLSIGTRRRSPAACCPRVADYLLAAWDYPNRPRRTGRRLRGAVRGRTRVCTGSPSQRGSITWAVCEWATSIGWISPSATSTASRASWSGWAAAERPWWAYNSTDHDVPIETFLLPPHSVSVNPGTEGGAVGWKSPIAGTVRITGRLADARSPRRRRGLLADRPRDAQGRVRARVGPAPQRRRDAARPGPVGRSTGIGPGRIGEVIQLQVALAQGMPTTISRLSI